MSGSDGVFRHGCVLLRRLVVWWRGEGLLRRERTHGRRWEANRQRGAHGGNVMRMGSRRERRSPGRETRRREHSWWWWGPHWMRRKESVR